MTRLVKAGLVAEDWNAGPTKGIVSSSVVVLVVRKGNPKHIKGWADLIKPGVEHRHPEPGLVGLGPLEHPRRLGARHPNGGTDADGDGVPDQVLPEHRRPAGSGREATTAFTSGTGDVLISYENEAIFARQSGADVDYIVPDTTLQIENPGAVTVRLRTPRPRSSSTTSISDEGQKAFVEQGLPPGERLGVDGRGRGGQRPDASRSRRPRSW